MRKQRTFEKIGETENSIIIGAIEIGDYNEVLEIAKHYKINTEPGKFAYHLITEYGAIKRNCRLTRKYNEFVEIFK